MKNRRQKCDVVFVFPPAQGNPGVFRQHLGVAYLRAVLAGEGMVTEQYCSERPGSVDTVTTDILARGPGVVGFTVYDSNFPTALAIAGSIKLRRPGTMIAFGGPTATFSAPEILDRTKVIDACLLGEAEENGPAILRKMLDGAILDEAVPGLAFRRGNRTVCGPLPPLVGARRTGVQCSLDATPSPYLTGVLTDGRAGVLTGRGCTHHCQYCAFAALGRKTLRVHSVDRVVSELECVAEAHKRLHRRDVVAIHDDAFTLLVPRAKEICSALIKRKLGLPLSCITRADTLDDEMLQLLWEAGFVSLAFGLESAVPEVLRATGKVRPPDWPDADLSPEKEFLKALKSNVVAAKKIGFNVGVSIILGLPTETAKQGAETLRFVRSLPVDYYMHNYLWLFPGTPLWNSGPAYGLERSVNKMGLPLTTKYAYDVGSLRPQRRCSMEQEASDLRLLAADAMYSCSTSPEVGRGTVAIVFEDGELTTAIAAWAREVLDIGGLLIQILPRLKRGVLDERLEHDRDLVCDERVPARHHIHACCFTSWRTEKRWLLMSSGTDVMGAHRSTLLTLSAKKGASPLRQWLEGKECTTDICGLDGFLTKPRDVNRFLRRINGAEMWQAIRGMPVPPDIMYAGKWLRGATPCRNLSRLEVDPTGCVRCCRHGDRIGNVGDTRRKLVRQLSLALRAAEGRRACAICSVVDCPRCPFPGMSDDAYCSIMKKQTQSLQVLGLIHVCSRIPVLLACLQERLGEG